MINKDETINGSEMRSTIAKMQVAHFGKIMFNLQFLMIAIMMASILSFIGLAIYYLLLSMIVLATLGLIFIAYPDFSSLWDSGEIFQQVAIWLSNSWHYTIPALTVISLLAAVCLNFEFPFKNRGKIAVSIIILIVSFVFLLAKIINGDFNV